MTKNYTKLLIAGIVLLGLAGGAFFYMREEKEGSPKEETLSMEEIGEEALAYINDNLLMQGQTASLLELSDVGKIYKIHLKVGAQEYDSFVTKDGKYLFPYGYDLGVDPQEQVEGSQEQSQSQEMTKRERPDVKVFVMSYCPYGLQAQKMFLPVYELLGKEADMGIYFVDYIMHEKKEIDENLRQYCIQKEEGEKYRDYLYCFLREGSYEDERAYQACLQGADINTQQLEGCIEETDREYEIYSQYEDKSTWLNGTYPRFEIQGDLNEQYGVRGSPTVVINDVQAQVSPRSPENFKQAVCEAFENPPEECSQTLSDAALSTGFGIEEASSDSGGSCGS